MVLLVIFPLHFLLSNKIQVAPSIFKTIVCSIQNSIRLRTSLRLFLLRKNCFLLIPITYGTINPSRIIFEVCFFSNEEFSYLAGFQKVLQRVSQVFHTWPLQFFDVLPQNGFLEIPKGPPLSFFGIVRLFLKTFHPQCPPPMF